MDHTEDRNLSTVSLAIYAGSRVPLGRDLQMARRPPSARASTTPWASVSLDLGAIRPTAIVRLPFGDIEDVDAVYGIGLSFGTWTNSPVATTMTSAPPWRRLSRIRSESRRRARRNT